MNEYPPEHEPPDGSPAARLKEERLRIGLSVKELCAQLTMLVNPKVSKQSYVWLECGHKDIFTVFKTSHWLRFSEIGFDVQYIMSGVPSHIRDPKEAALIENFRGCSDDNKQHLEAVSTAFKEQEVEPKWYSKV